MGLTATVVAMHKMRDGFAGSMGAAEQLADVVLASNPFYSEFVDSETLTDNGARIKGVAGWNAGGRARGGVMIGDGAGMRVGAGGTASGALSVGW